MYVLLLVPTYFNTQAYRPQGPGGPGPPQFLKNLQAGPLSFLKICRRAPPVFKNIYFHRTLMLQYDWFPLTNQLLRILRIAYTPLQYAIVVYYSKAALRPVVWPVVWPARCGQCCGLWCSLRAVASAAAIAAACALWPVLLPAAVANAVACAAACCGHCCRLRAAANPMLPPCGQCCRLCAAISVAAFSAATLQAHLSIVFSVLQWRIRYTQYTQ